MTRMTSSEAFVETMVAHGVTDVFGIVGSAYMDALDIFEPAGIRFWSVAHEQAAAHMADGYSRCLQSPRRVYCSKRSRHHQLRDCNCGGLLGPLTRCLHHPANGFDWDRQRRLPRDRPNANLREDHQIPGPGEPA